jgi:hypothetical protein
MNPKHKRRSCFLKLTALAIACWIVASRLTSWTAVQAAEPPKAARQASDAKQASPAAVEIANSEIIPRAEETVKSLQKIRSEVAADSRVSLIQKDFAAFAEKSDRRRESEAETISKSISVQRLKEIQREWSLEQSQLDDWEQALARRSQILAAREKEVDQIIESWRATQATVGKEVSVQSCLGATSERGFTGSPNHTPGDPRTNDKTAEAAKSGSR